jgi:hypothetical protein
LDNLNLHITGQIYGKFTSFLPNSPRKKGRYGNCLLYLRISIIYNMKTRVITLLLATLAICSCQTASANIKVNQVGFYPQQEKTFTLEEGNPSETAAILCAESGEKVWEGQALYSAVSPWSG